MKILSVIGARPQIIKAAVLSRVLRSRHDEILVHTDQHYDHDMSGVFLEELSIPTPDYNLNVGSGSHACQTARILERLETIVIKEAPDWVLVYGDTNSTLAGALVGAKLHVPVIHVEAGLRSFNKNMPEEINRIVADHASSVLFAPTLTAVENLKTEGIVRNVFHTGDIMLDLCLATTSIAESQSKILEQVGVATKQYLLLTIHRPDNADHAEALSEIFSALMDSSEVVIFPIHPRTRANLTSLSLTIPPNIRLIDPVGYLDMQKLEKHARKILTDSGGVQREAYFHGVPCITLRNETEWPETAEGSWNTLTGTNKNKIKSAIASSPPIGEATKHFGDGKAGEKMLEIINTLS